MRCAWGLILAFLRSPTISTGTSFIEQQLRRAGVGFRKNDNAFLWVADPTALQAAADALSAKIIRQRLEYWTLVVGPKFSKKERARPQPRPLLLDLRKSSIAAT